MRNAGAGNPRSNWRKALECGLDKTGIALALSDTKYNSIQEVFIAGTNF
jgi:hypothetical protein